LAVTLLAEGLGMAALLGLVAGRGRARVLRCAGITVLVNLISHTTFWFVFPRVSAVLPGGLLAAEGLVALAEAVPYRYLCRLGAWQALAVSLVLNLLSLVLGVEIWRWHL
jgi:hypothetical protein